MSESFVETEQVRKASGARKGWFATGGVVGALLASSCCILPFVLISLGVSGAWIGSLSALEPYKLIFIGAAMIFLAAGFWQVYFNKPKSCEDGSVCARPQTLRFTKAALWIASLLVLLALTLDFWAPLFY